MIKILRKYNLSCIDSLKTTKVLFKKTSTIQTWKISNSSSFTMTMKNVSILDKFMSLERHLWSAAFSYPSLIVSFRKLFANEIFPRQKT